MQWLDNLDNIMSNKKVGKCPHCGSNNTDYRMIQLQGEYGIADLWCNECKKAMHISRIKISNDFIRDIELPKTVKF